MNSLNKIRFSVRTKNRARLLNRLKGFSLSSIEYNEKEVFFTADFADKTQILDILSQSLYNNVKFEEKTVKSFLKKNLPAVLFVAIFLVFALFPRFVLFKVEAEGDDAAIKIASAVIENELTFPCLSKNIDEDLLQKKILSEKSVSFCEVKKLAGKLKVFVKKSRTATTTEPSLEIRSLFDGRITRIITLSGRSVVQIGQEVKKGDLLIEGKILDERTGRSTETSACGEVFGIETVVEKKYFPKSYFSLIPTGREKTVNSIEIFGIKSKEIVPYKYYRAEKEEIISKSALLPTKITSVRFVELSVKEVRTDVEYELEKLGDEITKAAEELFGNVVSISSSTIELPDGYAVETKAEIERKFN